MNARTAVVIMFALCSAEPGAAAPGSQGATATIAGVIVSTDSPAQPVRRAIVTLTGGTMLSNLSTVADEDGRFRFVDLAPGRYVISVAKGGYLPMAYGAPQPGRPGTSIAIAAGQKLDIRIVLPRGAVITGTVRDQFGHPAPGIQVTVSRADAVNALSGYLNDRAPLQTDDRGEYRAYGLMPGEYIVSAVPRVSGNGDVFRMTQAEIDTRERALRARTGDVAGTATMVAATPRDTLPQLPPITTALGYASTFYPGTVVATRAERIRVTAGEERTAVDIPLLPVRVARVSGILQSGAIPPERLHPSMTLVGPPQPTFDRPLLTGPASDGTFTFTGVTPGRYMLMARSGPGALMRTTEGRGGSTTTNPGVAALYATADVTVDGNDITGLILTMGPAHTISGRIVFDASTMKPPANLAGMRLTLAPVAAGGGGASAVLSELLGGSTSVSTTVNADATFELVGIVPGIYALSPSVPSASAPLPIPGALPVPPNAGAPAGRGAPGPGWWMRSAIADGRDLLDGPLEITAGMGNISDAVIMFTDRRSGLFGTLTTASGQPASEYVVIAFPVDRAQWRTGARRLKTTRPGNDGAFSLTELPAGEYFLAALTDLDPDLWQQAAFLEQVVPAAVKVLIADGERTRQDLRIARY